MIHSNNKADPALAAIIALFREISAIPRISQQEQKIRRWIKGWATQQGLFSAQDSAGNIVVRVPPSSGYQQFPSIALQAHLDMVGEKDPGVEHNFSQDPIVVHQSGDWLHAQGTTLGSDNGIGIALALYCAIDPTLLHPALELLFTVDEETGLTGAAHLSRRLIKSQHLINIDSEDEGILINGCAGGASAAITLPLTIGEAHSSRDQKILKLNRRPSLIRPILRLGERRYRRHQLQIRGMPGGHSGVDINKERGNAIIALGTLLAEFTSASDCLVGALSGGRAHNAIPREASAILYLPEKEGVHLEPHLERARSAIQRRHAHQQAAVTVELTELIAAQPTLLHSSQQLQSLLTLLQKLPNGVQSMLPQRTTPLLSANIANISQERGRDSILISMRSSSEKELRSLGGRVKEIATQCGAACNNSGYYPAWEPASHSSLTAHCQRLYPQLFGKPLKVEIIHAGLEPSVIAKQIPGLDMISIGPTLQYPHSPQERLSISSTAKLYRFLKAILSEWPGPQ